MFWISGRSIQGRGRASDARGAALAKLVPSKEIATQKDNKIKSSIEICKKSDKLN